MKKKYFIYGFLSLILLAALGYFCVHFYSEPDCITPATCKICGKTKGEALGHDLIEADCLNPQYCLRCDEIFQPALGHDWILEDGTYKFCDRCDQEEGEKYDYSEFIDDKILLYDIVNDYLVFSTDLNTKVYPASTTKLLTALIADKFLTDKSEVITVGKEIYMIAGDSSTAGLRVGDKVTVDDLFKAMLLPSGNDAAYVLAINVARKVSDVEINYRRAFDLFVSMMNMTANELGCVDSHFTCPDGYHNNNHYSSLDDLLKIAQAVVNNDYLLSICNTQSCTVDYGSREVTLTNSNELINSESDYYYQEVCGLKTGTTPQAGSCLISFVQKENRKYICIVMDADNNNQRYQYTVELLDSVLNNQLD